MKGGERSGQKRELRVRVRPAGKDEQIEPQAGKNEGAEEAEEVRPWFC